MRALLVNPEFPDTYWSQKHALTFVGRDCLLPPLALATVASLLPKDWELRLVDMNVEPLHDEQLRAADLVLLTGMLVQRASLHQVIERCRKLNVRTVVGGPYATALPDDVDRADHLVLGEGEEIVPRFAAEFAAGRAERVYREEGKPALTSSPVPRFDLLRPRAYHQMSLQFSRGCPFSCEFCDIIVMYGRNPRVKTAEQVVGELEAIRATGFTGDVFFVDDNFIGNKKAVRSVLPRIAEWRRRTRAPLTFYTEASMNLAEDGELIDHMAESGFTAVFLGIETPSPDSLRETKKLQNVKGDPVDRVHAILDRGLDVWGGFILGFDNDGPDIFDRMIEFVQRAAIPYAMVGLLGALPNTPLYHRLEREGRLRPISRVKGDQFGLTNVITKLPVEQMLAGYRRVLETLYSPEVYFERCRENLRRWMPRREGERRVALRELRAGLLSVLRSLRAPYWDSYWKFLAWTARHEPRKLARAVAQAIVGHHYMTYTRQTVIPTLEAQLRQVQLAAARVAPFPGPAPAPVRLPVAAGDSSL
ncbi:MAG: DUF4070 domain-containing protein [Acidobacteria bacterium]|nr:DUF4070 domain-containing protein [Acidobacteriota bacterium]